jgi:hypothetical protein
LAKIQNKSPSKSPRRGDVERFHLKLHKLINADFLSPLFWRGFGGGFRGKLKIFLI